MQKTKFIPDLQNVLIYSGNNFDRTIDITTQIC